MSDGVDKNFNRHLDHGTLVKVSLPRATSRWVENDQVMTLKYGIVLLNFGRTPGHNIWTYLLSVDGSEVIAHTYAAPSGMGIGGLRARVMGVVN